MPLAARSWPEQTGAGLIGLLEGRRVRVDAVLAQRLLSTAAVAFGELADAVTTHARGKLELRGVCRGGRPLGAVAVRRLVLLTRTGRGLVGGGVRVDATDRLR